MHTASIALTALVLPIEEIFYRFIHRQEWDISEVSFAKYTALTAQGAAPIMKGTACPECGNHTMIRKDGCDYCTACGYVGVCG